MRKLLIIIFLILSAISGQADSPSRFVQISGTNLVQPNGKKLFIIGTNLGNWLNPEGYMFGFSKTNCEWMISQMLCQLVGPDEEENFWREFKDNYITREDIQFIASTGANTVRLPFCYKIFTDEDYMGENACGDGFERIDKLVEWCREVGIYVILDMHDAPGGQTGDNIDNSFGYPWLFTSQASQQKFCDVWYRIAVHYKNEPVILGYELLNEPIAPYFNDMEELNSKLEPIYKRAVKAIRRADINHIILLGGAQWNGNFKPFTDWTFDSKIMYTCHRYGGGVEKDNFKEIIDFRNKTHLPMYMGETGHNSDQWQIALCKMLHENNIGYTFWPYKKIDGSCMMSVIRPADWDSVVIKFAEAHRTTFREIRAARPNQMRASQVLRSFIEKVKVNNCKPQKNYIQSMGLNLKSKI
jgi:endoglucanase